MNELRTMSHAEVDREMAPYFAERHAEVNHERSRLRSVVVTPADSVPTGESSEYEGQAAIGDELDRLLADMCSKLEPEFVPEGSPSRAKTTSYSLAPVKVPETILKLPASTLVKAPVSSVVTFPARTSHAAKVAVDASFPISDIAALDMVDSPLQEMTVLCRDLLITKDYPSVRIDYCRLSIQLNLGCKLPPAYRPTLKPGAKFNSPVYHQVNRDQTVIDLHWCHAKGMKVMTLEPAHKALFEQAGSFNFELALSIATMKWTKGFRASEALCLTRLQQAQLLCLVGSDVAELRESLDEGWRVSKGKSRSKMAIVARQIAEWAERDVRIQARMDYYMKLWLARALLGPKVTMRDIAALHAMMLGSDVKDPKTISDALESLDKHVSIAA